MASTGHLDCPCPVAVTPPRTDPISGWRAWGCMTDSSRLRLTIVAGNRFMRMWSGGLLLVLYGAQAVHPTGGVFGRPRCFLLRVPAAVQVDLSGLGPAASPRPPRQPVASVSRSGRGGHGVEGDEMVL